MLKLALIGKDISHSKSQSMYEDLLGVEVGYTLLDYKCSGDIPEVSEVFSNLDGLSITSPYKQHFLNQVNVVSEVEPLKSINCISKVGNIFYGTNTDYFALKEIIADRFMKKNFIILGDGVMARVTIQILNHLGLSYEQFSRKKSGDLNKVSLNGENLLIINTCSRDFVLNREPSSDAIFWDYNYSFEPHVSYFKSISTSYIDGLELLRLQARYALEFWNK